MLMLLILLLTSGQARVSDPFIGPLEPQHRQAFESSVAALSDETWARRDEATRALIATYSDWAGRVRADWTPEHPEARWRWQQVLDTVNELQALPQLLEGENPEVLSGKVRRLHRQFGDVLVAAMKGCLESDAPRVRQRAVSLLGSLPKVDLRAVLKPVVEDESAWVRRTLYETLQWRQPQWLEQLLQEALAREESQSVRIEVVRALRGASGNSHKRSLLGLWESAGDELKREIALALDTTHTPPPSAVLSWMITSGRYTLVIRSLGILDRLGPELYLPELASLLSAEESEIRSRAMNILSRCSRPQHLWLLCQHIDSFDPEVSCFAFEQLLMADTTQLYRNANLSLPATARIDQVQAVVAPAALGEERVVPAIEKAPRD